MPKSDLPFGSEFSPEIIDLPTLLQLVQKHDGNREALEEEIRARFFTDRPPDAQKDLAKNPILAMAQYGLIRSTRDVRPTQLATELLSMTRDLSCFYARFARHILLNCHGRELVETILDMQKAMRPVTLVTISHALQERGLYVPPLNVALLDGRDLASIAADPAKIGGIPAREAVHAMDIKKLEV